MKHYMIWTASTDEYPESTYEYGYRQWVEIVSEFQSVGMIAGVDYRAYVVKEDRV